MSEKEVKNLEEIFEARIARDEKIEPKDWMPRNTGKHIFVKFLSMHILKLLECYLREIGLREPLLYDVKLLYWPKYRMKPDMDYICIRLLKL